MATTAFIVGFFTALGWWSAHKVLTLVDKPEIKQEQKIQKEGTKDVNRN